MQSKWQGISIDLLSTVKRKVFAIKKNKKLPPKFIQFFGLTFAVLRLYIIQDV